jgi:hypothetical protein
VATIFDRPFTCPGTERDVVEASPNVFARLVPHDHNVPSSRTSELNPEFAEPVDAPTTAPVPTRGGGGVAGFHVTVVTAGALLPVALLATSV